MKASEVKVGGFYLAKVSGQVTTVRLDTIRQVGGRAYETTLGTRATIADQTRYDVTNMRTGRQTTFRSAAKFRKEMDPKYFKCGSCSKMDYGANRPWTCIACAKKANGIGGQGAPTKVTEAEADRLLEGLHGSDAEIDSTIASGDATLAEDLMRGDGLGKLLASAKLEVAPTSTTAGPMVVAGLASRIAATLGKRRQPGTPVAGMVPNEEQESILTIAAELQDRGPGQVLVIGAGAGTGKTATDRMLEQVLKGRGQYTAFNKKLVVGAKGKFQKCAVNTTHSLAFRTVGKHFSHRLDKNRVKSWEVAQILGITEQTIVMRGAGEPIERESDAYLDAAVAAGHTADSPPPDDFAPRWDRTKVLKASFLAGQVLVACRRFTQSADWTIGREHLPYIDGIDQMVETVLEDGSIDRRMGRENQEKVRDYLEPFLKAAWDDLSRVDGMLPFNADVYVKIWQLGTGNDRPVIAADYILLDEYQDTAPVFVDILKQQTHALLVLVGDDNQRIYEWRGAINAGDEFPDAERRLLKQSYRFGQAVADVANAILAGLEEPTDLVMRGNPDLPTRVAQVDEPRCYLYRTNAGAVGRIMRGIEEGRAGHLVGGGDAIADFCRAALDLQASPPRPTGHPELACFTDWKEVQDYSKEAEGADLRLMVKLIDEFGAGEIAAAMDRMPEEQDADFTASTAHKAKGLEWDTVRLGQDFPPRTKMGDPERRLLYVAATRAKLVLDISECPPFCGAVDEVTREWIPGIAITYTADMPTEEEQAEWLAAQAEEVESSPPSRPAPAVAPTPARPAPAAARPDVAIPQGFIWARLDSGRWGVRGPQVAVGAQVTVERRDGTTSVVTIRKVDKQVRDGWIYEV